MADSFFAEDIGKEKIQRSEPIGFIGSNYQRFYIHFTSITKTNNPYEYSVTGKTKVKTTGCDFKGTIKITEAKLYKQADLPKYKEGFTVCDVSLLEDKKQSSAGVIKGKLISYFVIDAKKQFRYNGVNFVADGFSNNEFTGTWTSYKTNEKKVCNWGDYRIPGSGALDIGAGEFGVSDKYVQNGWANYQLAFRDSPEGRKAKQIELEKWWQETIESVIIKPVIDSDYLRIVQEIEEYPYSGNYDTALKGGYTISFYHDATDQYLLYKKGKKLIDTLGSTPLGYSYKHLGFAAADFDKTFVFAVIYGSNPAYIHLYDKETAKDLVEPGLLIDINKPAQVLLYSLADVPSESDSMILVEARTNTKKLYPFPKEIFDEPDKLKRIRLTIVTDRTFIIEYDFKDRTITKTKEYNR